MDYLSTKFRQFVKNFVRQNEQHSQQQREITRFDVYLDTLWKILSWNDSRKTLTVFLALNFIFWILVQWQLKFYGIIFLIMLIGFMGDSYFQSIPLDGFHLEHTDQVDEVIHTFWDIFRSIKVMRRDNPGSFCIFSTIVFFTLSLIAQRINGYLLTYLFMLGIFFVPLGFIYLPEEYMNRLKNILRALSSNKGVLAEDELIPFIAGKDFTKRDPDLDSLLTDKTADSITTSLASGITASMPSYLDDDSRDGLQEDDLLPIPSKSALGDFSDSDSENIQFDSHHFNGDDSVSSSEEEERKLLKGLKNVGDFVDGIRNADGSASSLGGILTSVGSSFIGNALKAVTAVSNSNSEAKKPKVAITKGSNNSSDNSDFEFVDEMDLK